MKPQDVVDEGATNNDHLSFCPNFSRTTETFSTSVILQRRTSLTFILHKQLKTCEIKTLHTLREKNGFDYFITSLLEKFLSL